MQRQHHEVNEVRCYVENCDETGSECEGQRKIATWILNLCGGEGDVIPSVRREQRSYLRYSDDRKESHESYRSANSYLHWMERTERGVLPEMSEVLTNCLSIAPERCADQHEAEKGGSFGKGKDVLDNCASLHTENVNRGKE